VSLYESLDRFVAAGLLSCAPAFGCATRAGLIESAGFSHFLRGRTEGAQFGSVLDALAQEIWLARDRRGFLQEVCQSHALALADVLNRIRPGPEQIEQALKQSATANGHGPSEPLHRLLASDVVARARAEQLLQRAQLMDEVAVFLLEQLFFYLVAGPRLLPAVRSALIEYAAKLGAEAPDGRARAPSLSAGRQDEPRSGSQLPAPIAQAGRQSAPAKNAEWTQAAGEIAMRFELSDGAQRRFLSILSAQNLSSEQRLERLEEMARWLVATVAQLLKPGNQGPQVARLKAAAASALAGGDFEGAFEQLKQISRTLRDSRRQTEARLAEEVDILRHQMAEEADSTASLAELALARFDYDAAAELFAEAAGSVPKSEPMAELGYLLRRAEALYRKGEEKDDRAAQTAAAEAYRDALRMFPRGHESESWIRAKINFANALGATADSTAAGHARLEDAIGAYGEALQAIDRGKSPLRWARTQLSVGAALIRLGEIADRNRHWRAAVAALVPALEVFEQQGSSVYAEFARLTLRQLHDQIEAGPHVKEQPARTA
jgi:tetratricopeptide (TPR) repeat protein